MSHLKKEPNTSQDILEQSLWLNNNNTIHNKIIYWKSWTNSGIMYINEIIKQHNGICLTHEELQFKFNIKTNYMETLQIQSTIPKEWTNTIKKNNYSSQSLEIKNKIYINKSKLEIEKVKCKDFYWHLISKIQHKPRAITAWENIYTNFKGKDNNFSKTVLKIHFLCTFQYKVMHRTLPCNEWLKNIRIKTDYICSYCNNIDTISHFLIDCNSNKLFWKCWAR